MSNHLLALLGSLGLAAVSAPASAQSSGVDGGGLGEDVGRTAVVGSGTVGQRQTRETTAPNVEPMSRIETRLQNRVQNRLRNRIDRDYDPQANAAASFVDASEQSRRTGRGPRT